MTRIADITFKDKIAGSLKEAGQGAVFEYAQGFNQQIACCFPISKRRYTNDFGLHPFFSHLGSEGWLREKQARYGLQEQDDFGLLLRYGADCIGAVGVKAKSLDNMLPQGQEAEPGQGRTVSGVQRKILARKDNKTFYPAGEEGDANYIAKFNSLEINTLIRNEALSLKWLKKVLGSDEVTDFDTGTIHGKDELALIVKRFDRTQYGHKLRMEDFAQILCKPRGQDYRGKYNGSYEEIAGAIKTYSARPDIDLNKFFRLCIANFLIGNCDAHLKNFSLLETKDGLRLSPAYDVLNTAVYPKFEQNLALHMNGKSYHLDELEKVNFEQFGRDIELTDSAIKTSFVDIKKRVQDANLYFQPSNPLNEDEFINDFRCAVRARCDRILI